MSIKTRIHMKSMTESFEFVLIASLIGLVSDVYWCLSDILYNGFSFNYILILSGLLVATSCTIKAVYEHHKKVFKDHIKDLINKKRLLLKHKQRHR